MGCRALEQPRLAVAVQEHGGERRDWERIFDLANAHRYDEATLRAVQSMDQAEAISRRVVPMIRRGGRGGRLPAKPTLAAQFRGLFQKDIGGVAGKSDSWFDADFIAVDGVSGKQQSWVDYVDNTHTLLQASGPAQAALPAADANFGNAKATTFVPANTTNYQSSRAPLAWAFTNDFTGCTFYACFRATQTTSFGCIVETYTNGTQPFLQFYRNNGNGAMTFEAPPGKSSQVHPTAAATNAATYFSVAYDGSGVDFYAKATLASSALSGVPSAGAPPESLRVGSRGPGSPLPYGGQVRSVHFWRRKFVLAEHALYRQFQAAQTGIQ